MVLNIKVIKIGNLTLTPAAAIKLTELIANYP